MSLPRIFFAAFLLCPFLLRGQSATPASEHRYPDQAYLSSSRYCNPYFGFAFDFPAEAQLRPLPQAVATDGSVQLLELGGPPPADAEISVVAFPERPKFGTDARTLLRHDLDHELFIGVEELRSLSKTTLGGHKFYLFETRRGVERHMLLASDFDGYVLQVMLAAHDERILQQIETSFQHVQFFAPAQLSQQLGPEAQPYEGPSISSHRLALLQQDPPAAHIPSGEVQGAFYKNEPLGFSYRIPEGWALESEGAVEPALNRNAQKDDLSGVLGDEPGNSGSRERQLVELCSRTIFSAWAKRPGPNGEITYDDFGEVTISAAAASCFPTVSFPTDANDRQGVKDFLMQFGLAHPVMREMREAKVFASKGAIVLFLHGTVTMQIPNDELSRRLSVAVAVTERRGYLLSWFFAAPHAAELQQLLEERVRFDAEPASTPQKDRTTSVAKGSLSSASPQLSTASVQALGGGDAAQTPLQSPAANGSDPAPAAGAGTTGSGQQEGASSSRPTLLRPGETMQDQQVNGKPLPKPNH